MSFFFSKHSAVLKTLDRKNFLPTWLNLGGTTKKNMWCYIPIRQSDGLWWSIFKKKNHQPWNIGPYVVSVNQKNSANTRTISFFPWNSSHVVGSFAKRQKPCGPWKKSMWCQAALLLLANTTDQSHDLVVAHVDVSLGSLGHCEDRMTRSCCWWQPEIRDQLTSWGW